MENVFIKYNEKNDDDNKDILFKPLSWWRELLLKKEDLADYYRNKRQFNYDNNLSLKGLSLRDKFHPILLEIMTLNRKIIDKQEFEIINNASDLNIGKNYNSKENFEKPVIFSITHIGKFDYQIVSEAIKRHQIPFAGDPEAMYRTLDGTFLNLNGVVYCDTESKSDRKIAKSTALDVLNNNVDLSIYPEGVWNLSPNLLMLPVFPGVIEMAQKTDCDIIPIAIEQYDNNFYINIGSRFKVDNSPNLGKEYIDKKKNELRDVMATLKYDILEKFPIVKRSDLGEYDVELDKFVNTRLNEWVDSKTKQPFYNEKIIKHRTFKEKDIYDPEDVFSYIKNLEINKNNAFIFRKDLALPSKIQKHIDEYLSNNIIENEDSKNIKVIR